MDSKMKRMWSALCLEERILHAAVIISVIAVFLPWYTGNEPNGDALRYSGFEYFTSFIGIAVFIFLLTISLLTLIPLVGGPVIFRRKQRENLRLFLSVVITILLLAALSVQVKVSYEFSRIDISYGIYLTIIGSIIINIYAFLRWQEAKNTESHDVFHHPEDVHPVSERKESHIPAPPPPPPPPPLEPEELHIR